MRQVRSAIPQGFALLAFLFVMFSGSAVAQSTTSLRGIVTDAKGAVLPGATVTLSDPQTGFTRSTQSGSDGVYQFLQVPPATYSVTANASGFAQFRQDNLHLLVNSPATLNLGMQVQGSKIVVEVSGEAPLVNTQDATIGNVFSSRQLKDLPSEGRDPVSILSLQPGVTYIGSQVDQSNDSRGGSVSGARSDQTNITWDGLDNNDQLSGNAFEGALRATLDSLQEFRVTTSNSNADAGRSSGAQVSLVTKSGTNKFHGSLYEYNRPGLTANDWFNKAAQLSSGEPNKPGHLVRNTFGATLGGAIKKDRLFFFLAYEGQRTRETDQITRVVPSNELRQGMIQYLCDPAEDANCDPSNPNIAVLSDPRAGPDKYLVQLTPEQFAGMDLYCTDNGTCPLGPGANPAVLDVLQQYPQSNTDTVGDLLNFRGYTFAGSHPVKHDTYIVKLDYKLTANGSHSLFVRGNLQNDHESTPPQYPGNPPNSVFTDNSKGIAVGYTALINNNLINNFRYALVRQGYGDAGLDSRDYVYFRGLDTVQGLTNSSFTNVPTHNWVDDLTWTKGRHTLQLGVNLRLVNNNRFGNDHNFSYAYTDPYGLDNVALANVSGGNDLCSDPDACSLDPLGFAGEGYPAVDGAFSESYDFAGTALAGLVTVVGRTYNQDKNGNIYPSGSMVPRHFRSWDTEWYVQDSWRATPNLTITAGLRHTLLQPPYETQGNQAAPTTSIGDWFRDRGQAMLQGQGYAPLITFDRAGQANGRPPYWNWDYKNFAPRFAMAYSPHADNGWLHGLFGSAGKSSIRAGYGIYYDHFGQGLVNTFDRNGSFGLTTNLSNPYGYQNVDCADRFSGTFSMPEGTYCGQDLSGTPPGPLPLTPPSDINDPGAFAIYWGMDDKLKTPYSHVFDFSITRDLGRGFSFEASYIGRLGRHLLQETDLAMPEDIVDPQSHMDYFTAATMFSKMAEQGVDVADVTPIPYWENLFPSAAGGGLTATQAMYQSFAGNLYDEIVALQYADVNCYPACATTDPSLGPQPYQFFSPQFSSLWAWRTSGNSSYHGMNLSLRRAMNNGLQFDFNYTLSKSIDVGSNAERINLFDVNGGNVGGFSSQVVNSWQPNALRAVSDFDTRHQFNFNWIYELPVGHGRTFGGGMGRVANAIFGGWGLSGLAHWTSGLPFSIFPGGGWATNYNLTGEAIRVGNPGKIGVYRDSQGNPTMFKDRDTAIAAFRHPYPGESGQRNEMRGPGFFGIDAGLSKEWNIHEEQTFKFSWEVFNVTNSVRFDAASSSNNFDLTSSTNFGVYGSTLTKPRVMQFALRYEF
ncbi:MAG: carboxypeptidase regulatory-like domain-containing protein [Acidobacteria bacterium]|nr:carboxypeptidase regulatory-like domain-containing protein [Acidobacteriota bacterium]